MPRVKVTQVYFTCIPPKNEKEPRWRLLFAEEPFKSPPFLFLADTLDRIAPNMIEPNLVV